MIERIGGVAVVVSDEKKAKEWYRDKLGWEFRDAWNIGLPFVLGFADSDSLV